VEGVSSVTTSKGERMVDTWPAPYEPYLDHEVVSDPLKTLRAGLVADLKKLVEYDQLSIGLLSRIKERAKDNPEILRLCRYNIESSLFTIKLTREEIDLCE
jgi:hypothetical protein